MDEPERVQLSEEQHQQQITESGDRHYHQYGRGDSTGLWIFKADVYHDFLINVEILCQPATLTFFEYPIIFYDRASSFINLYPIHVFITSILCL